MKKKSRLAVILGLAILLLAACEKKEDYAPASDAEDKQKEILVQEEGVEESTSSVEESEYDFHENSIDQTFANFFHKNMCQVEYRDLQELYYIIWKAQYEKIILEMQQKCIYEEDKQNCELFQVQVEQYMDAFQPLLLNQMTNGYEVENKIEVYGNGTNSRLKMYRGMSYRNVCELLLHTGSWEYTLPTVEEVENIIETSMTAELAIAEESVQYKDIIISLNQGKDDIISELEDRKITYTITDEYVMMDTSVCLYFDDENKCVRISTIDELLQTAKGIHQGDSIDEMVKQYGYLYEKETYCYRGNYDVYRYYGEDSILEFGVYEGEPTTILNIDIYNQSIFPIYDYGPTLEECELME